MNKIAILVLSGLVFMAWAPLSAAQFGLEDEPVVTAPVQTSQPASTNPAANALPLSIDDAIATLREYQAAATNNDAEYLLSILSSPAKPVVAEYIQKKGLASYVSGNKQIVAWELRCAACWNDEAEGRMCAVHDRRYPPSKHNNTYYSALYVIKAVSGRTYITEILGTNTKRGRKVKKKQKDNNRVCDIDKGIKPKSEADPTVLIQGIGALIGAIQQ